MDPDDTLPPPSEEDTQRFHRGFDAGESGAYVIDLGDEQLEED
jgi:hypothetical protein